jgi:multiple sugar transport system substrate-binding protein
MIRAAIILGLIAACSEPSRVTLRLWGLGREGEEVGKLMAGFEREHPEIHVEVQQLPFTSAHEKLLTAFVGDATPDLTQLGNSWLPELAALGALAPLDAEAARSQTVRQADYFAGIWDTNRFDGRLYGVPWYVDTRLLFYNKAILAEAGYAEVPRSWAAWLDALRAIKREVGASRFAVLLPLDEYDQMVSFAITRDAPMVKDGGRRGNFESAPFKRALAFYLQMFVEGLAPVTTQIQVPNPWDELARGYFAFFLHGPWSIGEFKRRLPEAQQALWATAALPGPDGPGNGFAGGSSLVVFQRSPHPREAWALIEYLSRPEIQQRFYDLTGNLPPRRASWDDPRFRDPYVEPFRDQLERVLPTPPVPEWERIVTELRVVSEQTARTLTPQTTPAELAAAVDAATADLDARTDQILAKRRWMLDRDAAGRGTAP